MPEFALAAYISAHSRLTASRRIFFLLAAADQPPRRRSLITEQTASTKYTASFKIMETSKAQSMPKGIFRNLHLSNAQDTTTAYKVPASPLLKSLGYGTGVNVYYLERSPRSGQVRSPWAIKRVSKHVRASNEEKTKLFNDRIAKEAKILRQLKHPNIVGFRAITQENDGVETLALECCTSSLGLLLENRLEHDLNSLPAHHIKKMMRDVSRALDYLHTDVKILHGDLKSHNVLVKGDFEICKLCDFGVSLPLNEKGIVNFKETPQLHYVGTNLWCAPEVINEEDVIDSKAEIFSFGLIIYETIALIPPHTFNLNGSECEIHNDEDSDTSERVENFTPMEIAYGTRPSLPESFHITSDYNIILELFYLCTNTSPEDRPTAGIIYDSLTRESDCK